MNTAPARRSPRIPALDAGVLTVATVGAFVLRWVAAQSGGFWRDEAQFLDVVRMRSVGEMLSFLHYHESHPPLFYLLVRGWLWLTGGSDTAALLLMAVIGAAVVPAVYVAGRGPFGRGAGLSGCCFAAVSSTLILLSRQVRPYGLLSLLVLLSLYTLWSALAAAAEEDDGGIVAARSPRNELQGWAMVVLRTIGVRRAGRVSAAPGALEAITGPGNGNVRVWIGYVGVTAALVYVHNWGWVVLAAEWLAVALLVMVAPGAVRRRLAVRWVAAQAGVMAACLPWIPVILYQVRHAGHGPTAVQMPFLVFVRLFSDLLLPLSNGLAHVVVPAMIVGLGVLAAVRLRSRTPLGPASEVVGAFFLFAFVPVAAALLAYGLNAHVALLQNRSLMMLIPAVLLPFCALLEVLPTRLALVRLAAGAALCGGVLYLSLLRVDVPRSNARELAVAVAVRAHPDDLIVVLTETVATSFNYYFHGPQEQIDYPDHGVVNAVSYAGLLPRTADPARRAEVIGALAAARRSGRRVWLILLRRDVATDVPMDDAKLPPALLTSEDVHAIRARQILVTMLGLYGQPSEQLLPGRASEAGFEDLGALRFEAGGAGVAPPSAD